MARNVRVSVTLNRPYVSAIDTLVDLELYNSRPKVILQALREFLRDEKMDPFYKENAPSPA